MSNKLENKVINDNAVTSKEEVAKIKVQMMHYRGNSLSYKLAFLGIGFSILAAFVSLNSFYPDMLGFLKILMNIAILLFGFLCCEKVKAYSKQASIALCVIGGVCVLRIFWIPLNIMVWYNKFVSANETINSATSTEEEKNAAREVVTQAGKYIGKIITDSGDTINWLPKDGNFRAILAIVLLCCAAASFISAGAIGFIKSNIYLNSRNEKIGG